MGYGIGVSAPNTQQSAQQKVGQSYNPGLYAAAEKPPPQNYTPPGTPTMQPQRPPASPGARWFDSPNSPWPSMPGRGPQIDPGFGGWGAGDGAMQSPWPWGQQPSMPMPRRQIAKPWQVNPAVWDSLGTTGQQLSLSFAEDEGYDANDYQRQINATRPQGYAPRSVQTQYAQPRSTYR